MERLALYRSRFESSMIRTIITNVDPRSVRRCRQRQRSLFPFVIGPRRFGADSDESGIPERESAASRSPRKRITGRRERV